MKLTLKNVGNLIDETTIEFNGITVIEGENGVGKSTIGRSLYCLYDTFYDLKSQIADQRYGSVQNMLQLYSGGGIRNTEPELMKKIMSINVTDISYEEFRQIILEYLADYELGDGIQDELIHGLFERIKVSDASIRNMLLRYRLDAEFNNQIGNVNHKDEESVLKLNIRDEEISICINGNDTTILQWTDIIKRIVYFDDLAAIDIENYDSILGRIFWDKQYSHGGNLLRLFMEKKTKESAIEDILANERFERILAVMSSIGIGDLKMTNQGSFEYKEKDLVAPISYKNLSSGTKVFAILKQLIVNSQIEKNGIIIFDEPEVHLHPEWQKVLAELIVLLQHILEVTVCISTHSVDFVAFIEYYSKKYQVESKCKYYTLNRTDNLQGSVLTDVTDNTDEIYKHLSRPFIEVSEGVDEI